MKTLQFLDNPGFVFDILFGFVIHFNRDLLLPRFVTGQKVTQDTAYFNQQLAAHEDVPVDLFPFFYMKDADQTFLSHDYFSYDPYDSLEGLLEKLSDYREVCRRLLCFYFPEMKGEQRNACLDNPALVGPVIRQSTYPDALKTGLYGVLLDPEPVIDSLIEQLTKKGRRVAKIIAEQAADKQRLQEELDYDTLQAQLGQFGTHSCDLSPFDTVQVSFCMLNLYLVKLMYSRDVALVMLGRDYKLSIEDLSTEGKVLDLNALGAAFAEKNRTDVLALIVQRGEVNLRDVQQALGITSTNAYYHLSMMTKAGIVKTRNQGRMVMYSLNKPFFRVIAEAMLAYAEME